MLVLSRKAQQSIKIGDEITLHVFGLAGNRVKLGIDAPKGVRVVRSELAVFDGGDDEGGNNQTDTTQPSAA